MDLLYLKKIVRYFKIRYLHRIDKKILIYLIFVAISTIFWVLNKLDNEYTSSIDYPVRFTELPKNKILANELPKNLKLNVTAYGYDLLIYKISPTPFPIVLSLEKFGMTNTSANIKSFKLITRYAREEISNQLSNNITILDILPDTIVFQFANVVEKKIPVKHNLELSFATQCMLNGKITFTPDSITVKGPNTILDTLQAIYVEPIPLINLNKKIQKSLMLEEILNLTTDKKKVLATIPVAKFTEAEFEVSISAINEPDSLQLITFPRLVKVSGLVSLADYEKIKSDDFRIYANYNDIKALIGIKLPLHLEFAPSNIHNVSFYPPSVEYILEKKP